MIQNLHDVGKIKVQQVQAVIEPDLVVSHILICVHYGQPFGNSPRMTPRIYTRKSKRDRPLVYPLLRGRDVQRWHAEPSAYIILANRTDKLAGIFEAEIEASLAEDVRVPEAV